MIDKKRLKNKTLNPGVKKIGYVPQEGYLLNDTLLNNILFGQKKFNRKSIKKISKIVNLSNFISRKVAKILSNKIRTRWSEGKWRGKAKNNDSKSPL